MDTPRRLWMTGIVFGASGIMLHSRPTLGYPPPPPAMGHEGAPAADVAAPLWEIWEVVRRSGLRRRAGGKSKGDNPDGTPDCEIYGTCEVVEHGRDAELGLTILIALIGLAMCMIASFGVYCCCFNATPENSSKVAPDSKYLVSEEEAEIAAATKIQSMTRGRLARKKQNKDDLAATRIQAIYRGKSIRSTAAQVGKMAKTSTSMKSGRRS